MILLWIMAVLFAAFMLLCLIYLLVLVRPKKGQNQKEELLTPYAHRGLHGDGIPENSLAAFALACEKGYGIELDVQLSLDGEVMVFHDYTLVRMTGMEGRLCERRAEELASIRLGESDQTIPTLAQVLALVGGRVPILVELKGEDMNTSLCPKVASLLREYKGAYCIESFNPMLVRAIKKELPDAFCGLLYTNVCRDKKKRSVLNIALTWMALNFLARPNFIAYNQVDRHAFPVRIVIGCYRAPAFVWTVRTEEELEASRKHQETPIFENVRP